MVAHLFVTHAACTIVAGSGTQDKIQIVPSHIGVCTNRKVHPDAGVGYGDAGVVFKGNVAAALIAHTVELLVCGGGIVRTTRIQANLAKFVICHFFFLLFSNEKKQRSNYHCFLVCSSHYLANFDKIFKIDIYL